MRMWSYVSRKEVNVDLRKEVVMNFSMPSSLVSQCCMWGDCGKEEEGSVESG